MSFKSEFLNESQKRGFIHQCTDLEGVDEALSLGVVTSYTGFDPTGPSLHVGHLMPLMWLRLFQKMGHRPIIIVGGATSLIGDPSGKDTQRPLLSMSDIDKNIESLTPIFKRCIDFEIDSPIRGVLLNNYEWLKDLNYISFLRDYGTHFSVNRMLTFDSVRTRLEREEPLSFIELNYMIFQAYDFMHLNRTQNCTLQMAGSDQWGNIVNGIELSRRKDGGTLYGITTPLLTTSSGAKMGKTASGAVWLNPDKLSHFEFWQFWRNTADADVGRFLKIFTDLSLDEIAKLEVLQGQEMNEAKKILANEVTGIIRGPDVLDDIHKQVKELFENNNPLLKEGGSLASLACTFVEKTSLPMSLEDFAVQYHVVSSKGELRRLTQGGGVRINDVTISDSKVLITEETFIIDARLKISIGKKKHFLFS